MKNDDDDNDYLSESAKKIQTDRIQTAIIFFKGGLNIFQVNWGSAKFKNSDSRVK